MVGDVVGRSEGRGRKRRRKDVEKGGDVLRPKALVGRYVRKEFVGNGLFLGKVTFYDSGLYRVDYEDGDCEDLDSEELKEVLVEDDDLVGEWVERKTKLLELVAAEHSQEEAVSELGGGSPELPPSSGNIGIPEEYVSHLFSVYSFCRSFSTTLFLSPFGLDDFVGALNYSAPNSLLDSIHVALMRLLRRHLEYLPSHASHFPSKCLRNIDWSLLDTMTWPVYLVHYLTAMGYTSEHGWKGFYLHTLEKEYYSLSAGRKLIVLQILCDNVLDSEELRAEIDMHEESEVGIDSDAISVIGPRRVHPRYSKTSAFKDQEAIKLNKESNGKEDCFGDIGQDGNGDECRLCGMDGTLLCCDGCPSSYHSRCIGVSKMYIPEGAWYCPECTANELDPKITTLKGAQVFGVDSYGQIFMGTCNHLLVLKALDSSDSSVRYYHEKDVPKVLQALNANVKHCAFYSEICKGIMQYWGIPINNIFPNGDTSRLGANTVVTGGPSLNSCFGKESAASCENALLGNLPKETTQNKESGAVSQPGIDPIARQCNAPIDSLSSDQVGVMPNLCIGSVIPSEWTDCSNNIGQVNAAGVTVSHGRGCSYMGSSFKPQGYINSYVHGDFAASAAASLAVLSSEENQGSETRVSVKGQKHMAESFLLQAKAFSSVAVRFFWPNTEKKLVEVPRERCSWCLSCKAPVTSKRGCLLNAAASNAIKGALKILGGLRSAKGVEGGLPGIAAYIILMEESLTGLMTGPFQSEAFRKNWRKQTEQATSCSVIKSLLLQLEENMRLVAFSVDWIKPVDDGSSEYSITPSATTAAGSTHKRKPGRRCRKPMATVEVTAVECQLDVLTDFTWWRGGFISRFIYQKGTLHRLMVKKAARQGSVRKLPGIYYAEGGSEAAKRSRQLVWRAAVDMCKTTSQLAVQVRYLDMHVRWSDITRPEQGVQDGKGPETEASSFRNAYICDKRVDENGIIYGVAFGNQKHLPSRVMKNIVEVEEAGFWFHESRIPLYLIKEYEEKVGKDVPSANKPTSAFTLKKNLRGAPIFSYLVQRRDGNAKWCCSSCQVDVPFRNAVRCNTCQGLCHEHCTVETADYVNTCKQCYQNRVALTRAKCSDESPTSPLGQYFPKPIAANVGAASTATLKHSSKVKKHGSSSYSTTKTRRNLGVVWRKKNEDTGTDFRLRNIYLKGNADREFLPTCHLCRKPYNPDLMYICCETCAKWFHADAVGLEDSKVSEVVGFKCSRCRRTRIPICPYLEPEIKKQLEEKRMRSRASKMDNPGMEFDSGIISVDDEMSTQVLDENRFPEESDNSLFHSTSEELCEQFPEADCEWNMSLPVPKKLPVRRHVKNENDMDSSFASNANFVGGISAAEEKPIHTEKRCTKLPVRRHGGMEKDSDTAPFANNPSASDVELSTPIGVEWDTGVDMMFGLDMEFEPQTYFSFNELLASDEQDGSAANLNVEGFPSDDISSYFMMHEEEPVLSIESAAVTVPCKMCSHSEPCPDLCCQMCGVWIHSHCSPWVEESFLGSGWRCGNCRSS